MHVRRPRKNFQSHPKSLAKTFCARQPREISKYRQNEARRYDCVRIRKSETNRPATLVAAFLGKFQAGGSEADPRGFRFKEPLSMTITTFSQIVLFSERWSLHLIRRTALTSLAAGGSATVFRTSFCFGDRWVSFYEFAGQKNGKSQLKVRIMPMSWVLSTQKWLIFTQSGTTRCQTPK